MSARRVGAAVLLALGGLAGTAGPAAAAGAEAGPGERVWDFEVRLDGAPIGTHRFTLDAAVGGERALRSRAAFDVRFLGITVYRYRHDARETWRGDCLVALDARTDDDGKASRVKAELDGGGAGLRIEAPGDDPAQTLPGCAMSFAYWHPALLRSRLPLRLLNAQNGRIETVQITRLPDAAMPAAPPGTAAEQPQQQQQQQHWRISGAEAPIDLWYASDGGEWLGLDSTVRGGRKLQYRRR